MKIKLTNHFHNTETLAITKDGRLSKRQARRIERELCGWKDCLCQKWHQIENNEGVAYRAEQEYDGGYEIKIKEDWM